MRTPSTPVVFFTAACCGLFAATASAQFDFGESTTVGKGWIRSYVEWNAGAPAKVGVQFNQAALTAFSSGPDSVTLLNLPAGAPSPFNHLMVDWNANGHPGPGYEVPHFDFHFYLSTPEEVAAIPFSPSPQPVDPRYVASGYIPDPIVVPMMGQHFLDSLAPEFTDPAAFTQTFIYGYYGGKMTFVEPMITLATLQGGGTHVLPVRQLPHVSTTGFYASEYGFSVNDGTYDVYISKFNYRVFTPVPEPATWGVLAAVGLIAAIGWRRRQSWTAKNP